MSVHVDDTQVKELYKDLRGAPGRMQRRAPKVLRRGAVEIKKGMRHDFVESQFSGHHRGTYHPDIHRAINFDQKGLLDFEIGVDKDGPQGGLGNILAFGTSHNGAIVDHTAALWREAPEVEKHLGEAAEESVLGDRSEG